MEEKKDEFTLPVVPPKHMHMMVPIFSSIPITVMAKHTLGSNYLSICRCQECGYTEVYELNLCDGKVNLKVKQLDEERDNLPNP